MRLQRMNLYKIVAFPLAVFSLVAESAPATSTSAQVSSERPSVVTFAKNQVRKPAPNPANKRAEGKSPKKGYNSVKRSKIKDTKANKTRNSAMANKVRYTKTAPKFKRSPRFANARKPSNTKKHKNATYNTKGGERHLLGHWNKHSKGVKAKTPQQYQNMARKFMTGKPPKGVVQAQRRNGDIVRYNPANGHYGVVTASGRIKTYFKFTPTGQDVQRRRGNPIQQKHGFKNGMDFFKDRAARY